MAAKSATTAVAKPTATGIGPRFRLQITSVAELMALSEVLYKGGANSLPGVERPEHVARIILAGNEIGLSEAQSLDTIMLCNGKATIYGDGAMALVLASGVCESIKEWIEGEGNEMVAKCRLKRVGMEEEVWSYSVTDATTAELWDKKPVWKKHPKRMLQMRARGFAFRDRMADVLRGLILYEEALDYGPDVQTAVVQVTNPPALAAATSATDSPSPTTPPPPTGESHSTTGTAMLTESQAAEITQLRAMFLTSKGIADQDEQKRAWAEVLRAWGVKTAREFTAATAAKFIASFGEGVDPFGHPPCSASAA